MRPPRWFIATMAAAVLAAGGIAIGEAAAHGNNSTPLVVNAAGQPGTTATLLPGTTPTSTVAPTTTTTTTVTVTAPTTPVTAPPATRAVTAPAPTVPPTSAAPTTTPTTTTGTCTVGTYSPTCTPTLAASEGLQLFAGIPIPQGWNNWGEWLSFCSMPNPPAWNSPGNTLRNTPEPPCR